MNASVDPIVIPAPLILPVPPGSHFSAFIDFNKSTVVRMTVWMRQNRYKPTLFERLYMRFLKP